MGKDIMVIQNVIMNKEYECGTTTIGGEKIDNELKNLLMGMFCKNPNKRFGVDDLRNHSVSFYFEI